jgi:hypothetical protein
MAAAAAHPRLAQLAGSMSASTRIRRAPAIAAPSRHFAIAAKRTRQRAKRPAPGSGSAVFRGVRDVAIQASAPVASAGRIMSLRPTTSNCWRDMSETAWSAGRSAWRKRSHMTIPPIRYTNPALAATPPKI